MTADRIKTMSEALFRIAMSFLTQNCPQKPARTDTNMRYSAAIDNKVKSLDSCNKMDHILYYES